MKNSEPSWEILNAYVDGELTPVEAALVARQVAAIKALADQVAVLASLKAAISKSSDIENISELMPDQSYRPLKTTIEVFARRALLLAVLLIPLLFKNDVLTGSEVLFVSAQAAHHQWMRAVSTQNLILQKTDRKQVKMGAHDNSLNRNNFPDLKEIGLHLSQIRIIANQNKTGLHLGYLGNHGCRLSLIIWPENESFTPEMRQRSGAYLWRVGKNDYIAFASKMAPARFALIAGWLHEFTLNNAPLDPKNRQPLLASRNRYPPCTA